MLVGAIARCLEQFRDQIGSKSVVERGEYGGSKSVWYVVVRRRNGRRSRKKRLEMTRGRERRRLEGNKSPVIRVRPRHRPVDPVTQSTYWPRLGEARWGPVHLGAGAVVPLDSQVGRGTLDRGSGAQTLTLPLSLSQGTRAGSRYMGEPLRYLKSLIFSSHSLSVPPLCCQPKALPACLSPSLTRPWNCRPKPLILQVLMQPRQVPDTVVCLAHLVPHSPPPLAPCPGQQCHPAVLQIERGRCIPIMQLCTCRLSTVLTIRSTCRHT